MADGACADSYVRWHKFSFMEVPHGDRARGGVPQEAVEKRKEKDRRWKSIIISRICDSQLEYVLNHQTPKAMWLACIKCLSAKTSLVDCTLRRSCSVCGMKVERICRIIS